jgi:phospholipid/cholesterol/gamma-HCH transport system substrate-binding protein
MSRAPMREVRVGLAVVAGLVALVGLLVTASGGPGFLTSRRTVDVAFRDGQGIRVGSPVRVAGIDAGRVAAVELAEVDGALRAKLRLSLPADLADRLKVDAKVTIQASLTGQGCVNIVSAGKSAVALVPGQLLHGVETTLFDPILDQVGLGPVERSHLSQTIGQVRQTVEAAAPRLRQILASLQETTGNLREMAEKLRPSVEATAGHVEGLARRLDDAKVEEAIQKLHALTVHAEAILAENRPALRDLLSAGRDLTVSLQDVVAQDRPKVVALLEGFNGTRARVDQVLDQTRVITTQGAEVLTAHRADLERTIANVKDATDYGDKLVQKIFGNPFYLSPLYKPTRADLQAQEFYDVSINFLHGARELNDAVKSLKAMQSRPMSAAERDAYQQLFTRAWNLLGPLQQTSAQLAEGIKSSSPRR